MAEIKITSLAAISDPASTDVLPIVDVSADITNKISIADLLKNAATGSASAPSFAFDADPNTGMYRSGADALAFSTGGTGRLFIDSSGRLLVGSSTARSNFYNTTTNYQQVQIEGVGNSTSSLGIIQNYDANTLGPRLVLGKNNSQTIGSNVLVDDGDTLGGISFQGNDGTNFVQAAAITAEVDGTPGANDMPGRLLFYTNSDAANFTERMRIDSSGNVGIKQSNPSSFYSGARDLVVGDTTAQSGITIAAASTSNSNINFADGTSSPAAYAGIVRYTHTTDNFSFWTAGLRRMDIDSSGRLLIGTSSGRDFGSFAAGGGNLQVEGTAYQDSSMSLTNNQDAFDGSYLVFGKSRGTAIGSNTVVADDDLLGSLWFSGADGVQLLRGASIDAAVDGTPGTNDMPGRLVFSTTADGASSPTERMRIDSSGNVGIGTASPARHFHVHEPGTGAVFVHVTNGDTGVSASDGISIGLDSTENALINLRENKDLRFATNNAERMRIDSSGNVGIGTSSNLLSNSTRTTLSLNNTGSAAVALGVNGTREGHIYADANGMEISATDNLMYFTAGGSERVRIHDDGKISIGTSSASYDIYKVGTEPVVAIQDGDGTVNARALIQPTSTGVYFGTTYSTSGPPIYFTLGGTTTGTKAVKIANDATLTAGNSNATSGQTIIDGWYTDADRLNVFGSQYSSGGTVLSYACKPKSGAAGYVSSAGNGSFRRVAIELGESSRGVTFKHAAAATVAVGTDVTLSRIAAFTPNGLCFGDDTAAANALDDYEEGTWTPVFTSNTGTATFSYTVSHADYVKIGRMVHITAKIDNISWTGSPTSYAKVEGAPFTKVSGTFPVGSFRSRYINFGVDRFITTEFVTTSATTTLYFRSSVDNSAGVDLQISDLDNGSSSVLFDIVYYT